ncbi:MAG: PIG-L family deacetylase [Kiritimatiellae bacterium]|nr:PIG-L family deacetylase [Kiritimatiellia bacterium]
MASGIATREKGTRVLAICAHDDDEVIGVGGTLRSLVTAGADVTTLIFANGNEGYQRLAERDLIVKRRVRERAKAQRILGTRGYIVRECHDFENLDREDVYREVMRAVRAVRPQLVFSHLPTDYLAHRTLAQVVPEAVWQAGWLCSLELGRPWSVNRLYLFSVLELVAKPSHIVDISATFADKLRAMRAYRSQHEVVPDILNQIEARARVYGAMAGVRYGEAFRRSQAIPVVCRAADLPVSRC